MEQKLCTQCANSRKVGSSVVCQDKRNLIISLVDGRERGRFECEYLRNSQTFVPTDSMSMAIQTSEYCGPEGKWFIPRDTLAAQDAARMNAGFGEALELTKKAVK